MQGGAVHNGKNAHNVYGFFRKRWASRSAEEKRSERRKVAPPYSHARSSFRSQHQLDDFFRDIWLEAFSMPLVESNHIGNDVPVAAFGIHEHPRSARSWLETLHATPFGVPETRVPHVAGCRF